MKPSNRLLYVLAFISLCVLVFSWGAAGVSLVVFLLSVELLLTRKFVTRIQDGERIE